MSELKLNKRQRFGFWLIKKQEARMKRKALRINCEKLYYGFGCDDDKGKVCSHHKVYTEGGMDDLAAQVKAEQALANAA